MKNTSKTELGQTLRLYARPGFKSPSGRPLSPLGEEVKIDAFWLKRLRDGSVTLQPPAPSPTPSSSSAVSPRSKPASGKAPPNARTSTDDAPNVADASSSHSLPSKTKD